MITDQRQAAINAAAVIWLADLLDHAGLDRTVQRAEHVVRELITRGIGHAEPPPAPRGPGGTPAARRAALDATAAAVRQARLRHAVTTAEENR